MDANLTLLVALLIVAVVVCLIAALGALVVTLRILAESRAIDATAHRGQVGDLLAAHADDRELLLRHVIARNPGEAIALARAERTMAPREPALDPFARLRAHEPLVFGDESYVDPDTGEAMVPVGMDAGG